MAKSLEKCNIFKNIKNKITKKSSDKENLGPPNGFITKFY